MTSKAYGIANFESYGLEVPRMWDTMNKLKSDAKDLIKTFRDNSVGEKCITNLAANTNVSPCVSTGPKAKPKTS